jgi:hypothetical protein
MDTTETVEIKTTLKTFAPAAEDSICLANNHQQTQHNTSKSKTIRSDGIHVTFLDWNKWNPKQSVQSKDKNVCCKKHSKDFYY